MLRFDPQNTDTPRTSNGPVIWGVATAIVAGAALLLASFSPFLLAAGVAAFAVAAVTVAAHQKDAQVSDTTSESWEASTAKFAACMDCLERVPDEIPGRFQAMVSSQESAGKSRLH
jgi:hypothetical protein